MLFSNLSSSLSPFVLTSALHKFEVNVVNPEHRSARFKLPISRLGPEPSCSLNHGPANSCPQRLMETAFTAVRGHSFTTSGHTDATKRMANWPHRYTPYTSQFTLNCEREADKFTSQRDSSYTPSSGQSCSTRCILNLTFATVTAYCTGRPADNTLGL